MADFTINASISLEQIAAVIRQMSSSDRQRLLDLVPELRPSYQARPGQKPVSSSASPSSATTGEYDETATGGQRPPSSGGSLDVGIDWMTDLSRKKRQG
jgi:hypothetical protein